MTIYLKNAALMRHSTRIAVQVIIDDDTNSVASLVLALSILIAALVKAGGIIGEVSQVISDVTEAVSFTIAVFAIGFKSLAWGLGVTV